MDGFNRSDVDSRSGHMSSGSSDVCGRGYVSSRDGSMGSDTHGASGLSEEREANGQDSKERFHVCLLITDIQI